MKKLLIIGLMILTANNIFAQASTTGVLTLTGQVDEVFSISVADVSGVADSLDLTASPTNLKVAAVTESTNSSIGYNISMKSAGNGFLKNGTVDSLAYEIKYGASGTFATPSSTDVVVKTATTSGVTVNNSDVFIKYTGKSADQMASGTYTDNLTFTISAK
ncbi:MAG: fimbrial protein [Bacteriovoracaceae bacterium]|nr:fimbrial protein [Bacteriovoracaceae bacterium]